MKVFPIVTRGDLKHDLAKALRARARAEVRANQWQRTAEQNERLAAASARMVAEKALRNVALRTERDRLLEQVADLEARLAEAHAANGLCGKAPAATWTAEERPSAEDVYAMLDPDYIVARKRAAVVRAQEDEVYVRWCEEHDLDPSTDGALVAWEQEAPSWEHERSEA